MKLGKLALLLFGLLAVLSAPYARAGEVIWDQLDLVDRDTGDGTATRYFVLHTDVYIPSAKLGDFKAAVASNDVNGALLALIPPAGVTMAVPPKFYDLIDAIVMARADPFTGPDVRCTIALKAGNAISSVTTATADFRIYLRLSTQTSAGITTQTATSSLNPNSLQATLDSTAFSSAITTLQGQVSTWLSGNTGVANAINNALGTLPVP